MRGRCGGERCAEAEFGAVSGGSNWSECGLDYHIRFLMALISRLF